MELSNNLTELHRLVYTLLARIEVLEKENAVLRVQLGMNSKNSHKPPSTDIFVTKPALSGSKGKQKGGQKDHKGNTLKMVETPDLTLMYSPTSCSCCNSPILLEECNLLTSKRQVFDIPFPRLEVTEHQLCGVFCCGIFQQGQFPVEVKAPVQYGTKIHTLSNLLSTDFRLPFRKISSLFETLYGYKYNEGTAISANEMLYNALAPIEEEIKKRILESEVVHFDETGLQADGNGCIRLVQRFSVFCFYMLVGVKKPSKI